MPTRRTHGPAVLVAANSGALRDSIVAALRADLFQVHTADGADEALNVHLRHPIQATVLGQDLGAQAVSRMLAAAAEATPHVPVIVLGNTTDAAGAVFAFRNGATDFLSPPIDAESVLHSVKALIAGPGDGRSAERRRRAAAEHPGVPGLVGSSPAMRHLHEAVERISRYKANVLLLGESGTGKELVARALHGRGRHRQHLFVPLNCAALSREIIENELFGHERGAFTGANERKKGLFELADGGTLFLDEIAEMDVSTQAKLLRVIERGEFRRLGGASKIKVDVGIIAATNRNLEKRIAEGRFREDLYYRLKVVTLTVPPLRERKEDIPALVESFISDFNRRNEGKIKGVAPQAQRRLMEHDWPGNVRELKNAIESAAVLAVTDTISEEAIGEILGTRPRKTAAAGRVAAVDGDSIRIPFGTTLDEVEQQMIAAYVTRFGTRVEAARALGIGLRTLYTKLRQRPAASAKAPRRRRRVR